MMITAFPFRLGSAHIDAMDTTMMPTARGALGEMHRLAIRRSSGVNVGERPHTFLNRHKSRPHPQAATARCGSLASGFQAPSGLLMETDDQWSGNSRWSGGGDA